MDTAGIRRPGRVARGGQVETVSVLLARRAIESADVVLMSGDLRGVVNAVEVSKRTMSNIRQNLVWAFGYNVALIPVAAGVLYPAFGLLLSPVFAAGAMALSSVSVLTNALRLRRIAPAMTERRSAERHVPQTQTQPAE